MRLVIWTSEPENVKTALATNFNCFELSKVRKNAIYPVLGHGIFSSDGPAWERSRALVRPNFSRSQVADLELLETHVSRFLELLPKDDSDVDLQNAFFSLTMDSATEFLFGKSTNTQMPSFRHPLASDFVEAYSFCVDQMAFEFRTIGLLKWLPNAEYKRSQDAIHKFADSVIAEAILTYDAKQRDLEKHPSGSTRYVFLEELISRTRDPYVLRSELLNILLAGRDTTAGLLSCSWWVLARRPDIFAKLQAEVKTFEGKIPTYERVKDLKYLKYFLNESLRLMPIVPRNGRICVKDTVLPVGGGPDEKSPVFIAKGTLMLYSPWTFQRDKKYYGEDAEEFKPERWEHLRTGWEYLPFNGGPRICVGQQFALMEASYVTIRMLQTFEKVEAGDGKDWCENITLTLASGTGCHVSLYRK